MQQNSLQTYAPIDKLTPYGGNARFRSARASAKLRNSLQSYGQLRPVVVDEHLTIIDGHAIWLALRDLGYDEVAIVVASGRSEAEIRALRIALNRLSRDARWNGQKLRAEI